MLQDYQSILNAKVSAEDAYRKVARVSDWWNQRSTGDAQKLTASLPRTVSTGRR